MNRKAIIGTIVWGLILFILISSFIFYVNFKGTNSKSENKTNDSIEVISLEETSVKTVLGVLTIGNNEQTLY